MTNYRAVRPFQRWSIFVIILSCFILESRSFAQEQPEKIYPLRFSSPIDSLPNILLTELTRSRILMIGDAAHGRGFYMRQVTGLLEEWTKRLDEGNNPADFPRKLFLFLEADSLEQRALDQYWVSGDISPVLSRYLDVHCKWGGIEQWMTTDKLEFLYDLRNIMTKIKGINTRHPGVHATFTVIGGERTPPYDYTIGRDQARARDIKFQYFAHERDKLSAERISSFLENDPASKAIIYIGQGHLETRTLVNKSDYDSDMPRPPAWDFFLPHFLDERFGRSNVRLLLFFYHSRDSMTDFVQSFVQRDTTPDIYAYTLTRPPLGFSAYILRSQMMLTTAVELARSYLYPGASEDERILASTIVRFLVLQLRRTYLNNESETRKDIDSLSRDQIRMVESSVSALRACNTAQDLIARFDILKDVDTFERARVHPGIRDSAGSNFILKMWYHNLPQDSTGTPDVPSLSIRYDGPFADSAVQQELIRRHDQLDQMLLVNLLWVTDGRENARIVERLQSETGLPFVTAKEWTRWSRKTNWPKDRTYTSAPQLFRSFKRR